MKCNTAVVWSAELIVHVYDRLCPRQLNPQRNMHESSYFLTKRALERRSSSMVFSLDDGCP